PDDVELFERLGVGIARQRPDAATEQVVERRPGAVPAIRRQRMADAALPGELDSPLLQNVIAFTDLLKAAREFALHGFERLPRADMPQRSEIIEPAVVEAAAFSGEGQRPDRAEGVLILFENRTVSRPRDADHAIRTAGGDEGWLLQHGDRQHRPLVLLELHDDLAVAGINHTGRSVDRAENEPLAIGKPLKNVDAPAVPIDWPLEAAVLPAEDADAAVVARSVNPAPICGEGDGIDRARMAPQNGARRELFQIPQPGRVVPTGRCSPVAVTRHRQSDDLALVTAEAMHERTRRDVPNGDGAIVAGRKHPAGARDEGHRIHRTVVVLEPCELPGLLA